MNELQDAQDWYAKRIGKTEEEFDDHDYHCAQIAYEYKILTGLKDKNGREIKFGDKVKIRDLKYRRNYIGEVKFGDGSFYIKSEYASHFRWMDYKVELK